MDQPVNFRAKISHISCLRWPMSALPIQNDWRFINVDYKCKMQL